MMENIPNEEIREGIRQEPRRRKPQRKPKFSIRLPKFLAQIGADVRWYYDIRLWSPLLLLMLILALTVRWGEKTVVQPEETIPETTAPVVIRETEPPTEAPVNEEAAALARLADSVGQGRSDNVKTIIMWVAINRSEAGGAEGYGLTLIEEINRANQWQGYDAVCAYTKGTYEIALRVLETQQTGGLRPLDSDMYWLVLNNDGSISVRNRYIVTANTRVNEKTFK